jgi:flagellar hook-basal body complex protein FliE
LSLKEKLGSVLKRKKAFDDSEEEDDDKEVADKNENKKSAPAPASSAPQPKTAAPVKVPDADTVKIEKEIANLQEGLGRIESSITKAMTASSTGFEDNIKGLMQKLDDVVIAMQSAQSDKNSPFNSTSLVQELPETVGLQKEEQKTPQQSSEKSSSTASESPEKASPPPPSSKPANHKEPETSTESGSSNSLMESIADVLQQQHPEDDRSYRETEPIRDTSLNSTFPRRLPQVVNRLQEFVKSCALLEIVEGDQKRLNYLYDIGVLRTEDLETASRIVDLLGRYSPNLKPVDLAIIACSIEETAASDRETRKLLAIATALNKSR